MTKRQGPEIDAIRSRFESNLARVRSIVEVYEQLGKRAKGRRSVRDVDLLRSAVVLLHATFEDLLRGLAEEILPSADRDVLDSLKIPFMIGGKEVEKLSVPNLANYRGVTVDELIARMVRDWLGRSSYNNLSDVKKILKAMGFPDGIIEPYDTKLAALMRRRHLIVHRADRHSRSGPGHHAARSISKTIVIAWIRAVGSFGMILLDHFHRGELT